MTKNNLPTNLKETNSNRLNRRSLIGHHRMANLLRLISVKKCRVDIQKLNFNKSLKFSNLSKEEWTAHQNLKTRYDIVIKPADKGGAVVVWRTDLYKQEAFRQLADTKFYAKVNKDLTQANQKIVKDTVNKLILEQKLPSTARNLFLTTPKTSTFYFKPKIHKPNNPGRPIISACSCPTELISSFLDKKMAPFVKSLPTNIKDTNHALNILKQFSFPGNNKFPKTSFEKNCFSAWASTLNMGLINKVDMVCLSPVGYGV